MMLFVVDWRDGGGGGCFDAGWLRCQRAFQSMCMHREIGLEIPFKLQHFLLCGNIFYFNKRISLEPSFEVAV